MSRSFPFRRIDFAAPEDWDNLSVLALVDETDVEEDALPSRLLVTCEAFAGDSIGGYAELAIDDLSREVDRHREIQRQEIQAAGRPAVLAEHQFHDNDGEVDLRQLQLYVAAEGFAYTVSLTGAADDFDRLRPIFDRIVATLALGPA